ncbi:MAG TPA: TolC family protein [Gemmatimonadales bacterium]
MRRADLMLLAALAAVPAGAAAQVGDSARAVIPAIDTAGIPRVTLGEAVRLAEQVQPSVVQAQAAVENADARLRTAKAQYLPTLNLNSNTNRSFSGVPSRVDPNTGLAVGSSSGSLSMSLSSSVDLFTGFRRGADARAARASGEAAEASLVDARYQQALTTTNQFFDALAARQLLAVRAASVRRAEEQLKVSVNKLAAGSATRSDSLRSRVTLGNAQLQLIQAQSALATAEANLARLIGRTGRVAAADDSAFSMRPPPLDSAAIRAEAEARSPQLQAALASSEAARASYRASRSAYWPTLSLSGNVGMNGSSSSGYDLYDNRSVSLGLSWPLFNRFQREQNIETQRNAQLVAEAQAAEAARAVSADITAQLAQLEAASARITITQMSVLAAQEDLRVQQERYRLGASTIVDLLTSQEALDQAEVDVVNARFDYLRARAQIEAIIGRSL